MISLTIVEQAYVRQQRQSVKTSSLLPCVQVVTTTAYLSDYLLVLLTRDLEYVQVLRYISISTHPYIPILVGLCAIHMTW